MNCSGESALSSRKQTFLRKAGSFGFLPNTSLLLIILVGFIRLVVLLSDLMRPVKSSPNNTAELAGTLFANFCRESWTWSFMLSLLYWFKSLQDFARIDKESTAHVIKLFNWGWYAFALTLCSLESFIFRIKSLTLMIAEVALLICIVIFSKIMSWPLKWELYIFSPFQISSLHLGINILSQFSGIEYFDSLSLDLSPEMFCCQRLFTMTARSGDTLGPCFSSSAKSLESWSRKGSVGACDSVEISPTKSILSGEFLTASRLANSVSRWPWSGMLILSSGIFSSSEVSTYLLPCSALSLAAPWSSCITHLALVLVSVLVWGLILSLILIIEVLH